MKELLILFTISLSITITWLYSLELIGHDDE